MIPRWFHSVRCYSDFWWLPLATFGTRTSHVRKNFLKLTREIACFCIQRWVFPGFGLSSGRSFHVYLAFVVCSFLESFYWENPFGLVDMHKVSRAKFWKFPFVTITATLWRNSQGNCHSWCRKLCKQQLCSRRFFALSGSYSVCWAVSQRPWQQDVPDS